jgi:hypothetical protein
MTRATSNLREFAVRLIAHEAKLNNSPQTGTLAGFLVSEKFRPHLATLMGTLGFRALVSRALALASAQVPWLHAVHVKSDGMLDGLDLPELEAQVSREKIAEGGAELIAQLLGLLVTFIGANLTLQLVCDIWPRVPLSDLNLAKGEENEK